MTIAFIILGVLLVLLAVIRCWDFDYIRKARISIVIMAAMSYVCVYKAYVRMSEPKLFFFWIFAGLACIIIGLSITICLIKYEKRISDEGDKKDGKTVDK